VSIPTQLLWFGAVGAIATLLHYLILIGLVESGLSAPATASVTGYLVSATVNYLLNRRLTFASTARHTRALPRFALTATGGASLNAALVFCGNDLLGLNYLIAQIGATLVTFVANFIMNRLWTFSPEATGSRDCPHDESSAA
jgi:putative flippase GtrA